MYDAGLSSLEYPNRKIEIASFRRALLSSCSDLAPPPAGLFLPLAADIAVSFGMAFLIIGTKVRVREPHRPPQVRWGIIGTVVDTERPAPNSGADHWVRVRFGDFITPWIEWWQLERVS
jgi:hypothetical protein